MVVTVVLSGMPQNVTLKDLAYHLDNSFNTSEIGTFRVRDLPNSYRTNKRQVALDFSSGYDAMYAQNFLDSKPYTLPDGDLRVLRARVTNDPELMSNKLFTPTKVERIMKHSSSSEDNHLDVAEMSEKQIWKANLKMDAQLKLIEKKKQVMMSEHELILEKRKLLKQLKKLKKAEKGRSKRKHRSDSSSSDSSGPKKKEKKRKRSCIESDSSDSDDSKRKTKVKNVHKKFSSRKLLNSSKDTKDVEDFSGKLKKRYRSWKSASLSSDNREESSKMIIKSTSSRKSRSPSLESEEKLESKYEKVRERSPSVVSVGSSIEAMELSPHNDRDKRTRELRDKYPHETKERLSRHKATHESRDGSSHESRIRSSHESSNRSSRLSTDRLSRESRNRYSRNDRSSRENKDSYDRRCSQSHRRRESPSRVPKNNSPKRDSTLISKGSRRSSLKKTPSSDEDNKDRRRRSRDRRSGSGVVLRRSPSAYYGRRYSYNHHEKQPLRKAIEYRPNISEALNNKKLNPLLPLPIGIKKHEETIIIDRDMKSRNEQIKRREVEKIKEEDEARYKKEALRRKTEEELKANRDKAVKDILLENEKHFNQLCVEYKVTDIQKKVILKELFDIVVKRIKKIGNGEEVIPITCASNIVMIYRCDYSKTEDKDLVMDLFKDLISSQNADTEMADTSTNDFWNDVGALLQELELETFTEDLKPKIEDEEVTNITIQLNPISKHEPEETHESNETEPPNTEEQHYDYYININIDPDRKKKFFITTKTLIKQMKCHINQYETYMDYHLFVYVIQRILEKQLQELLAGVSKQYRAKELAALYRETYPAEGDKDFVLQVLYDIYAGKHNDEVYADEINTAHETEANAEEKPLIKQEIDTPENEQVKTDIKNEKEIVKTERKDDNDITVKNESTNKDIVKTEMPTKTDDILLLKPKFEVIDLSDIDTVKKEIPASNDDDVLVLEAKFDVIDVSDNDEPPVIKKETADAASNEKEKVNVSTDDDVLEINISSYADVNCTGDRQVQNVRKEASVDRSNLTRMRRQKQTKGSIQRSKTADKRHINDVICLSDTENDPIVLTEEESPEIEVKAKVADKLIVDTSHRLEISNITAINKENNSKAQCAQTCTKNNFKILNEEFHDESSVDTVILDQTDLSELKSELNDEGPKTNELNIEATHKLSFENYEANNTKLNMAVANISLDTSKDNTVQKMDQTAIERSDIKRDAKTNSVTNKMVTEKITKEISISCAERNKDFCDNTNAEETVESIGNYLASIDSNTGLN